MVKLKGIKLNENDNVATTLSDANDGDVVEFKNSDYLKEIKLAEAIPYGFKLAVQAIRKGEEVIKYGEIIGVATKDINRGDLVHTHNVEGQRARGDLFTG